MTVPGVRRQGDAARDGRAAAGYHGRRRQQPPPPPPPPPSLRSQRSDGEPVDMASLRGRLALLLLVVGILAGLVAQPETVTVLVLSPDSTGDTAPATDVITTLPTDSLVLCAAHCHPGAADCLAVSYQQTAAVGGNCSLRGCPADWRSWQHNCYYIGDKNVPRQVAVEECAKMGARLATVHSSEENEFIRDFAVDRKARRLYLGMKHRQPYTEANYTWEDGSQTIYTNYANDSYHREPYASLKPDDERVVYFRTWVYDDDCENKGICKSAWHTWSANKFNFTYICKYKVQ